MGVPPLNVTLHLLETTDLPLFFQHQCDPEGYRLVGFPPKDENAFAAHWQSIRTNGATLIRTIRFDDQTAGYILSFWQEQKREVGYWLGREFWGKGIASAALRAFLPLEPTRPLHAQALSLNTGSLRVLQKCGFEIVDDSGELVHLVLS